MLQKISFIKRKSFSKTVTSFARRRFKATQSTESRRKRVSGFILDETFPYIKELQALLIGSMPIWSGDLVNRLKRAGNIKVVITSGVFVGELDGRLDILVVGDN